MEPRPIPPSEAPEASEAGIQWYHIAGGVVGAVGLLAGVGWFAKKMQEIDTPKTSTPSSGIATSLSARSSEDAQ